MHRYLIGGTGSGKSVLVSKLIAQQTRKDPSTAIIYFDLKLDDSKMIAKTLPMEFYKNDKVRYVDILSENFAMNFLSLPAYAIDNKEFVMSSYTNYIIESFREMYNTQSVGVQLERILKILFFYLYHNTDTPTFSDLYKVITQAKEKNMESVKSVMNRFGSADMQMAVSGLSDLRPDSWLPILNRIEPFVIDPFLSLRFNSKYSSLKPGECLQSGQISFMNITRSISASMASMVLLVLLLQIWFYVTTRQEKNPIILVLDEFQVLRDSEIIKTILSQGRAYGLFVWLIHQDLGQITPEFQKEIRNNISDIYIGNVSGSDGAVFSKDVFASETLQRKLVSLKKFHFVHILEKQETPIKVGMPLPQLISQEYFDEFLDTESKRLIIRQVKDSFNFDDSFWLDLCVVEPPSKTEWLILCTLRDNPKNLTKIVADIDSNDRDMVSKLLQQMNDEKKIKVVRTRKMGNQTERVYGIGEESTKYFPTDYSLIGQSKGIDEVATAAFNHNVSFSRFVTVAKQKGDDRVDMLAYDYDSKEVISIEIESESEVSSHPEQVKYNGKKWIKMGFDSCQIWSKSKQIRDYVTDCDVFVVE